MALSIRNKKAEALARQVARATGESLTDAILHSLEDPLARLQGRVVEAQVVAEILDIARRCGSLPDLDSRPPDDIVGYGKHGEVD